MENFDPSAVFSSEAPETPETPPAQPAETAPEGTPAGTPPEMFEVHGVGPVSREELIKGYLRQQDYTRKTMSLSQQQRETETLRQQAAAMEATLQQAREIFSNRAKLEAILKGMPGAEPELPPDQMLTTAEVRSLLQRERGETEAAFMQRLQQAEQRIVTQTYQAQYEQAIDSHLRVIGDRHPELRSVPGVEILIRQAVASQKPRTIEEAFGLFDQAAQFYSNRLKASAKSVIAPPNNPVNRGIEPPSGRTPIPGASGQPAEFGGVKDPNLRNLVMQDIERVLARQTD